MLLQKRSHSASAVRMAAVMGVFLLFFPACVSTRTASNTASARPTVRLGVGEIDLQRFVQNFTVESLARVDDDGRVTERLAAGWSLSGDGKIVTVHLRPNVLFHDGTKVTAGIVAETLKKGLASTMGPAASDVLDIRAVSETSIELMLRRSSPFALESLETTIQKPNDPQIGTAAFQIDRRDPTVLLANDRYYLGAPTVQRITISRYPTVRSAWADLLRDRLDMIYEVGSRARESLQASTTVTVYPFVRRYQYLVLLNVKTPSIQSAAIRRALNEAVDRNAFVNDALAGHGLASQGPVWPKHWAAQPGLSGFEFAPSRAANAVNASRRRLQFKCLVSSGDERPALVLQRQLQAVGIDLVLQEGSITDNQKAVNSGQFEAFLAATISGPSLLRPYDWWHSAGSRNRGGYNNPAVDRALDRIRYARTDDEYRAGVVEFQQEIRNDPPAIFLAWDESSRAVSNRFVVPAKPGVDMMGAVRLLRVNPDLGPSID